MTMFLIVLGVLVFAACLGVMDWLWHRDEHKRTTRLWDERERLLDRRTVLTLEEILRRRSRRG